MREAREGRKSIKTNSIWKKVLAGCKFGASLDYWEIFKVNFFDIVCKLLELTIFSVRTKIFPFHFQIEILVLHHHLCVIIFMDRKLRWAREFDFPFSIHTDHKTKFFIILICKTPPILQSPSIKSDFRKFSHEIFYMQLLIEFLMFNIFFGIIWFKSFLHFVILI